VLRVRNETQGWPTALDVCEIHSYRNDGGEVLGRVVALSCIAKQKNLEFEKRVSPGRISGQLREHPWPRPGASESPGPDCHCRTDRG